MRLFLNLAFGGCLLACAGIACAAPPARHAAAPAPAASSAGPAAASSTSDVPSLSEIQTFTRAFEAIKQAYVDPVSNRELMRSAIQGMVAGLDPHSEFLDTRGLKDLNEDTFGAYTGLGIEVAQANHQLVIVTPIDGGPAKKAGIQPGDVIIAINGVPVDPDDIAASIQKLRGPIGSKITLTVLHGNAGKPATYPLVRARIQVASVRTRMLEPGYAYIRISEFQDDTADELTRALKKLQREHGPLRGVVLDLRSNPGGLLTSAVGVADDFLNSGTIVTTRGRMPQSDLAFSANPGGDLLHGAPMVVLVDNGTASAAEIVTGALKDNHRALIMGRRTFGKGSVQTILPLAHGEALKLTTARYYTPNGTSIQVAGITPDIVLGNVTVKADSDAVLDDDEHESDLPNHLAGTHPASHDADAGDLAIQDYALSEALHVLKGLALARADATPAAPAAASSAH